MHLTTLNSKSEPNRELTGEFLRVFWNEPPEAIEWAFRAWRNESSFFPAIADIRKLLHAWHRDEREKAEAEKRRAEREAIEQARKEGKLLDFAAIVKQMRETMNSQPEPEHLKREREFRRRMERSKS